MTRELALAELEKLREGGLIHGEVFDMAIAALREPVLDENGLVPCGCGGKPVLRFGKDWKGRPDDSCFVICEECGEQSGTVCGEYIARGFWNRSHGLRRDA